MKFFYIAPLLLWMSLIFFASTGAGSGNNSMRLIRLLLSIVSPDQAGHLSGVTLNTLNVVLRKAAHVTEYAILTLLAVRAIQFGEPKLKWSAFFGAFAISLLFAMSDELHQRFVPGRGPSPVDVAIDLVGVTLVMAGMLCWFAVKNWERTYWQRLNARTSGSRESS